jgi:hypothetical protein
MAVIRVEPEDVEQLELRLPDQANGANTLIIVTGRILAGPEADGDQSSSTGLAVVEKTYIFHAGPELEPLQVRSVRASAAVASVYAAVRISSAPPPGPCDFRWALGAVDAVHDDDVRKARIMINATALARFGGLVRIEQLRFELRIMARL